MCAHVLICYLLEPAIIFKLHTVLPMSVRAAYYASTPLGVTILCTATNHHGRPRRWLKTDAIMEHCLLSIFGIMSMT